MIRNNLAVLLAQKQIKISRMALDTGLSRTTLTALSQNESKRIDNDTLNTILMYLQVTPDQFFNFVSYDFEVQIEPNEFEIRGFDRQGGNGPLRIYNLEKGEFDLFLKINDRISQRTPIYEFEIKILEKFRRSKVQSICIQIDADEWEYDKVTESLFVFDITGKKEEVLAFNTFIQKEVPFEFQEEIAKEIISNFQNAFFDACIAYGSTIKSDELKGVATHSISIISSDKLLTFKPF